MTLIQSDLYETFIEDNFDQIINQFKLNGLHVEEREDFDTYSRWQNRGFQVKWGHKSTWVDDRTPRAHLCSNNRGRPLIDDRTGKQAIRTYKKRWFLFHKSQTELIPPVKTYWMPTT